jgi:basic membrane protein A
VNKFRLAIGIVLLLTLTIAAAGCAKKKVVSVPVPQPQPVKMFKVAFVYTGTVNDKGWTQAQDQGRRYLEKLFSGVETSCVEAVNPGDDAELMLAELAEKGNRVIFATDASYSDAVLKVAKRYPKTVFMVCSGAKTAPNVGVYAGRMYQPRYLAGLVAGKMTGQGLIGYVAAEPGAEEIRDIDAFALGVQKVNPKATVQVVWTHSRLEPQYEKDAVKSLIRDGADIIVQQRDDPSVRPPASERAIHFIGSDGDLSQQAPLDDLVSTGWNWGPIFAATVKAVQDGTWSSGQVWGDMSNHTDDLTPLNPIIPEGVGALVASQKNQLLLGTKDVFVGPLRDQRGVVRLKSGKRFTDNQLLNLNWFVDGIKISPSSSTADKSML